MKVQGFEVKTVGFNYSPDRNETTSILRNGIKQNLCGLSGDIEKMTFAEKCQKVQNDKGVNTLFIDAVRGAHLGWS